MRFMKNFLPSLLQLRNSQAEGDTDAVLMLCIFGLSAQNLFSGRGGGIWTHDLHVPNVAPCHWATPRLLDSYSICLK